MVIQKKTQRTTHKITLNTNLYFSDLPNIQLLSPYSSTTTRSRSPTIIRADEKSKRQLYTHLINHNFNLRTRRLELSPQAIQELLGNAINTLVKYFEKSEPEVSIKTD